MHQLQIKHIKLKDEVKRLQVKLAEIEEAAIAEGLAERKPTLIEEFRWPKGEVLERWGLEVWSTYKRDRIEERFKWR